MGWCQDDSIGMGVSDSGQVPFLHDVLGITGGEPSAPHVGDASARIEFQVERSMMEVRAGRFVDKEVDGS